MDVQLIRQLIHDWFEKGVRDGRRFLIVWQDNFNAMDEDMGLWPEYADDGVEVKAKIQARAGNRFDKVMEILDLERDYKEQIEAPAKRTM